MSVRSSINILNIKLKPIQLGAVSGPVVDVSTLFKGENVLFFIVRRPGQ